MPEPKDPQNRLRDLFGEVVYAYTRAEALADGVLIDVTETAKEAGFRLPVALTAAAWADCVAWSDADSERQVHQDESGRLWDVVFMASVAIRSVPQASAELRFPLHRVPRDGRTCRARPATLKLVVGPGDQGEPVVTLMMPEED